MLNQALRDPKIFDMMSREWLNDTVELYPLRGRQWRLGTVDMWLHDAERSAKFELEVPKSNCDDNIILQTQYR
jgi:hypothetical protein